MIFLFLFVVDFYKLLAVPVQTPWSYQHIPINANIQAALSSKLHCRSVFISLGAVN